MATMKSMLQWLLISMEMSYEYSGRETIEEAPAVEAAPAAYEYVEEAAVAPAEEPAAEPADDFGW